MQSLRPRRRLLDRLAKLRRNETGKGRRALALASPPAVGLDGLRGRTLGDRRQLQPKLEGEISPLISTRVWHKSASRGHNLKPKGRRHTGVRAWVPRLHNGGGPQGGRRRDRRRSPQIAGCDRGVGHSVALGRASLAAQCAAAAQNPRRRRAPADHGDVLRSRRFDGASRHGSTRRLAQPRQRLSRRSLRRGDASLR